MKTTKNVLWISLLGLAMMVTGCRKDLEEDAKYYHSKVLDVTVLHTDWEFDEKLGQFYCHKYIEELTEKVYDYGSWELYKEYKGGTKNAYQVALPTSVFLVDTMYTTDTIVRLDTIHKINPENLMVTIDTIFTVDTLKKEVPYYFTEYLDYRVGLGYVEIQLTYSDYYYPPDEYGRNKKPDEMNFRMYIEY